MKLQSSNMSKIAENETNLLFAEDLPNTDI